jgi:aminoglycoside 3-N-acetyltransferase
MSASADRAGIRAAVRELELPGRPVCAHASLRSFGHVEGGADAIVDAFLDEECTFMVASFSGGIFGLPPPHDSGIVRNGVDERFVSQPPHDRVFSPESNEHHEMGALVDAVLRRPGRSRGNHPLSSFSAVGPMADELVKRQRPLDVYAPLADLAKRDGAIVLMGVGLTRMTLIHLAEKRSGRTLFRRWANHVNGDPMTVEAGSCSDGFDNLEPALRPLRRETTVGDSRWQVYDARSALNVGTAAIRRDQRITHCGEECPRCDDATAGGPILPV